MNQATLYQSAFEEYYTLVHCRINKILMNPSVSEDLTQETFIRLLRNMDGMEDLDHVRRWLLHVAHNLAIDYIRKNQRLTFFEDETAFFGEEAAAPAMDVTANLAARELLQQILDYVTS